MNLLKVSNLRIELDGRTLVADLSFELNDHEILVVLGPNGAGKTVLLRALLGLLPHQGEILWRGDVKFGYVPQRVPLNKELPMTVSDFFGLKGLASEAAWQVLQRVGITNTRLLETQIGMLSSGLFQRVLIAWAMVEDPNVLLLDEPTAGVDLEGEEAIHALFRATQTSRAHALILVTHDLNVAQREATHILFLNQGQFCYGPPEKVLDSETFRLAYG